MTPVEEKQVIAVTLLNKDHPQQFASGKPGQPDFNPVAVHLGDERPSMAAFVSEQSWLLFSHLGSRGYMAPG